MKLFKGRLTASDGEVITDRTGHTSKEVTFSRLPKHGDYIPFFYDDDLESESPGVILATDEIEKSNNKYTFVDIEGREFILEVENE